MVHTIPVRTEDAPFLYQVYAETRRSELDAWGWDEAARHLFLQMQWNAQQHAYAAAYPDADSRIIICRGLRAGRILPCRSPQELILVDLALLPDFRNEGIGTRLLGDLQQEAAAATLPLRLSALHANPARRLYERLGFTVTGDDGVRISMEWRMAEGHAMQASNTTSRGDNDE